MEYECRLLAAFTDVSLVGSPCQWLVSVTKEEHPSRVTDLRCNERQSIGCVGIESVARYKPGSMPCHAAHVGGVPPSHLSVGLV